jgi:hypothetical protein
MQQRLLARHPQAAVVRIEQQALQRIGRWCLGSKVEVGDERAIGREVKETLVRQGP